MKFVTEDTNVYLGTHEEIHVHTCSHIHTTGRGAKRGAKQNFQWSSAESPIFYYPPEYPEDEEEEEEPPPQKAAKPRGRKVRVDRISE